MKTTTDVQQSKEETLGKKLSLYDFFVIGFGAIIGVGWVISIGTWIDMGGGPLTVIVAFIIGAVLLLPIAKLYGDLAMYYPKAGGALVYAKIAYGRWMGYWTGWFLALGYIMLCPWEVIAIGQVAESLFPALQTIPLYTVGDAVIYLPSLLFQLGIAFAIIFCNFRGVDLVAKVQRRLVELLTLIGILSILIAFIGGKSGSTIFTLDSTGSNPDGSFLLGVISVLAITPFYYSGFDTISQEAEEYQDGGSGKGIGKVIVLSIVAASLFYILIILAVSRTMPWQQLISADMPAVVGYEVGLRLPFVAKLLLLGALCGLISTLNSFFMSGARVLLALGRDQMIPAAFASVDPRFHTPIVANLLVAVVAIVGSFLPKSFLLPITNVCSFSFILAWFMVGISSFKLARDTNKLTTRSTILHILAIVSGVFMLFLLIYPRSPGALKWPLEWLIVLVWIVIGVVCAVIGERMSRKNS